MPAWYSAMRMAHNRAYERLPLDEYLRLGEGPPGVRYSTGKARANGRALPGTRPTLAAVLCSAIGGLRRPWIPGGSVSLQLGANARRNAPAELPAQRYFCRRAARS